MVQVMSIGQVEVVRYIDGSIHHEIRCHPGWTEAQLKEAIRQYPLGDMWDYGITSDGVEVFSTFRRVAPPK